MLARNTIREFAPENYYHVYNRGNGSQEIFIDEVDYLYFLSLLKKYLSNERSRRVDHALYPTYAANVELLAFCLMPNHFHLLLYQVQDTGITELMKSLGVSYSMYFNKRHGRTGSLFQQRFRALRITHDSQLLHISRYIHMNPKDYRTWPWSSLDYFIDKKHAEWIHATRVNDMSPIDYLIFLQSYESRRDELKKPEKILAG